MKKVIGILLIVCMIFMLGSCVRSEQLQEDRVLDDGRLRDMSQYEKDNIDQGESIQEDEENYDYEAMPPQFEGKIAIVASTPESGRRDFYVAEVFQRKFSEDKIIHRNLPVFPATDSEIMHKVLQDIAADAEVSALIISQATINTNSAVDAFLDIREDVFIVYIDATEDNDEVAVRADMIIRTNYPIFGEAYVHQVKAMGGDTIVQYSFPRHMVIEENIMQRDVMKESAKNIGLNFVEAEMPDPLLVGRQDADDHIMEDLLRRVNTLGENTAFTTTDDSSTLLYRVIETGVIFISTFRPSPSPLWYLPVALGIGMPDGHFPLQISTYRELISEMREAAGFRGATGRLASWPMSSEALYMTMAMEYAIRWINGEVDRDYIDLDVLTEIGREIIYRETGEPVGVSLERHPDHPNFILAMMDFIVY